MEQRFGVDFSVIRVHTDSACASICREQSPLRPATDDRCANFSASTCPFQTLKLTTSSTADKLPLEKFHRLLDLAFWGGETSKNINTVLNSL